MMADEFDRASELEQLTTELAIKAQLRAALGAQKVDPVGYCLNPLCGEDFDEGSPRLYCDAGCEREHRRLKIIQGE